MSDSLLKSTAAESIAETAKALTTPFSTERGNLSILRMGAEHALHELEMQVISEGKRSISTTELLRRIRSIREALRSLPPEGK